MLVGDIDRNCEGVRGMKREGGAGKAIFRHSQKNEQPKVADH